MEDARYTGSSIIDDARNVCDYIFTKAILLAKFVKISSLENYHLYSTQKNTLLISDLRSLYEISVELWAP